METIKSITLLDILLVLLYNISINSISIYNLRVDRYYMLVTVYFLGAGGEHHRVEHSV